MRTTRNFALAVGLALFSLPTAALVVSMMAAAQGTTPAPLQPTPFDVFGAWGPYVKVVVDVAVYAVIGVVGAMVARYTGLKVEGAHRDALQATLTNAAGLIVAKVGPTLMKDPQTGVQALDAALTYVRDSAPDALKYFGLTDAAVKEKLMAKVGVLVAANTPPAESTGGAA